MKVLLFTGAGTSAELGVPAMRTMAEQFIAHLHDIELEPSIVERVERLIVDAGNDMEHAIDVIDKAESGFAAQRELGVPIDESQIIPFRTLREEAEWFVQHSCEQIKVASAVSMWTPTLRMIESVELTIASTNYDRAIEITASRLKKVIEDGFEPFAGKETAGWKGFGSATGTRLLKLHGSTDWYHGVEHQVFKLRHPMPLYGPLEIVSKKATDLPLHSALVLPSREKQVTLPPFPELGTEFRSRAADADVVIFVGSSLRDPHIRDVCAACARAKPTFVISKSGSFAEGALPEGATVIRQSSGQFLISTFPRFLQSQDVKSLTDCAASGAPAVSGSLEWIVTARGANTPTHERCTAIENLANAQIPLPRSEVELILRSTEPDVSLYGLGLIQASPDRDALLGIAKTMAEQKVNAEFSAELKMLEELAINAVGILAYGSLIGDAGAELEPAIVKRIDCRTPFKVEFARSSDSRNGAPTLVPYDNGTEVAAQVLVVNLTVSEATNRLYRRELHKVGEALLYDPSREATPNWVVIKTLRQFQGVDTVLYTSIGANIDNLSATKLAELAISSARELKDGSDGISYLMNAKKAGVTTLLSDAYEKEISRITGADGLSDALKRLHEK